MNNQLHFPGIDFADSRYQSLKYSENTLTVFLEGWDESIIQLRFVNPIEISYKIGDLGATIYETHEGQILKHALSQYYENIPQNCPFKLFQIMDIQDFPFIEIVAESVTATKELRHG